MLAMLNSAERSVRPCESWTVEANAGIRGIRYLWHNRHDGVFPSCSIVICNPLRSSTESGSTAMGTGVGYRKRNQDHAAAPWLFSTFSACVRQGVRLSSMHAQRGQRAAQNKQKTPVLVSFL
jgi:hypothetical protein